MTKNNQGVTMVSLVVTITVLGILSGIMIFTSNSGGMTVKTTNALKETTKYQNETEGEIENLNKKWGDIINN